MLRIIFLLAITLNATAAYALLAIVLNENARDYEVVKQFRALNPCPVKSCDGTYVVDHIVPLCAGGADSVKNMQWQEKQESFVKDNAERELCWWIRKARKSK